MKLSKFFVPGLCLIFVSGFLFAGVVSCRHDDSIDDLDTICFQSDILPIFETSCATTDCHNSTGGEAMDLSNYTAILQAVTPGNAMKSEVYTVLSNVWSQEGMMPPDRPISLQNRTKIKVWIEQGAKETKCP